MARRESANETNGRNTQLFAASCQQEKIESRRQKAKGKGQKAKMRDRTCEKGAHLFSGLSLPFASCLLPFPFLLAASPESVYTWRARRARALLT
jgi:hypothetical protein